MKCSFTSQQAEVLKNLVDKQKEYSLEELLKMCEEHSTPSNPNLNDQPTKTPWAGIIDTA
jgi:hypothetical protein